MSTQPELPNQQPARATESRLLELRSEAANYGKVQAVGARIPGAPFPIASPETGYYGVPLLKQPQWTWEIPLYFFVGGAAASAAIIGAVANWTRDDERLRRDARLVAAAGAGISSMLLIADLGKHERFLNMLRVFKPQSPMSMGAWILALFGTSSGAVATAELLEQRFGWRVMRVLGNIAEPLSVLAALPFSNYTGVLIGATVVPVWN
ncbi:MAG TPA: NrfD/PsrC family molybdoenzyme membrane anchor subunit, partial [Terriglobales bacterium]